VKEKLDVGELVAAPSAGPPEIATVAARSCAQCRQAGAPCSPDASVPRTQKSCTPSASPDRTNPGEHDAWATPSRVHVNLTFSSGSSDENPNDCDWDSLTATELFAGPDVIVVVGARVSTNVARAVIGPSTTVRHGGRSSGSQVVVEVCTVHVGAVPAQLPDQPSKRHPPFGATATSVRLQVEVPSASGGVHESTVPPSNGAQSNVPPCGVPTGDVQSGTPLTRTVPEPTTPRVTDGAACATAGSRNGRAAQIRARNVRGVMPRNIRAERSRYIVVATTNFCEMGGTTHGFAARRG
jgi:hypothetical protein